MTTAFWCVLAAGLMPYLWVGIAKFAGRGYDNANVRDYEERLTGMPKRAHWAHLNSFEAFPLFAAAVIIAHVGGAPQERTDLLALVFIVLRLAYGAAYLANIPPVRSLLWLGAIGCSVAILLGVPG